MCPNCIAQHTDHVDCFDLERLGRAALPHVRTVVRMGSGCMGFALVGPAPVGMGPAQRPVLAAGYLGLPSGCAFHMSGLAGDVYLLHWPAPGDSTMLSFICINHFGARGYKGGAVLPADKGPTPCALSYERI